jgi:hypothetical protein
MRIGAGLVLLSLLALGATSAAAGTTVTLHGDDGRGEVCRFRAGHGIEPFERWMGSQELVCVASGSTMAFQPGLWNVFARSNAAVSIDPILVDGASPPESLTISLAAAATLVVQLPAGQTGVVYLPKRVTAFPANGRTAVPAAEELWLFVLVKSVPAAVVVVPPVDAGGERVVDARNATAPPAVVGWVQLPDRSAVKAARGVSLPRIRITSAGKDTEAAALPAPEALDGALVLVSGVPAGDADLQLAGRGWLPLRRRIAVRPQPVTLLREPIVARASATLVVNWSTLSDLPALDRAMGSCQPSTEAPRFELTISSCPSARPGEQVDPAVCQSIRREPLRLDATYGTVTVGEVAPGPYRAELRFGKLPPSAVTSMLAPLEQQPILLQASYVTAYGSLRRGGQPLGEDARIEFPGGGIGFVAADSDEYHAVLTRPVGEEAKIDIVTCRGERTFVLTDRPMMHGARFDIDIPDNVLTVTVVDTFTRMPIGTATVRYAVMSARMPRIPVLTRVLTHADSDAAERASESGEGRFVVKAVPPREIRLQVSNTGYKTQDVDPFTMTKSDKKDIEVQLVPLGGSQGKIVSQLPFANGAIFWSSAAGVQTERADLAPDGTFFFEQVHYRGETMTVVSLSHPLWITPAPSVERARPLEVAFPDAAPQRAAEVWIAQSPDRARTLVGVAIGGMRVPAAACAQHLILGGCPPVVRGAGPLVIPALAETGPIDILRGPAVLLPNLAAGDAVVLRDFAPFASRRLVPGIDRVVFDGK